jgi:AraC-like DNA-binding protein
MRHFRFQFFLVILMWCYSPNLLAQSCLKFISPVTGSTVTTSICTILVEEDDCPRSIRKVEFQVRYFPEKSDTATILNIGDVSREPYEIAWDISQIPNQLFSGASFFAEATLSNGEMEAVRREGVFLLHQPVDRVVQPISYDFPGMKQSVTSSPITLTSPRPNCSLKASIYWNEKELTFKVTFKDPQFTAKLTKKQLASLGVEILLDPLKSRKPFPGKDVFIYSIPLYGKPYRVMYKPIPADSGSFSFATSTLPCDFDVAIQADEQQGFTIYCPLPVSSFGVALPKKIGCNIIVKTMSQTEVIRTSWINASLYDAYSPFIWGELQLQPRPNFMNRPLVAGIAFGGGFLLTLFISLLLLLLAKPSIKTTAEQSESDKQQFAEVKEVLDTKILAKNVSIDSVAKALNTSPKKLSQLVRRATGLSFPMYVMYERIEIAKERLRSSHCTEEAVAQTCGFHSVHEMEKFFQKFHHITPAKFRNEQQVV